MPFCHKCRCDKPTVEVLMNFDGTEHVIDMKDRYDGSPDVVAVLAELHDGTDRELRVFDRTYAPDS